MAKLNMPLSFSSGENIALVSTQRISQEPDANDPGPAPPPQSTPLATSASTTTNTDEIETGSQEKEHHKHSLFSIVRIHGFLLACGFYILTFGVLGIRSGFKNAYKVHWVMQAFAGSAVMLGCLLGIWISFKVISLSFSRFFSTGKNDELMWIAQIQLQYLSPMDRPLYPSKHGHPISSWILASSELHQIWSSNKSVLLPCLDRSNCFTGRKFECWLVRP